jgi:hypothetical protein
VVKHVEGGSLVNKERPDQVGLTRRIRESFAGPGITLADRFADVVVVVSLLAVFVSSQRLLDVGYSRTRTLMLFYVLVAAALLSRFWRRVPPLVAWSVAVYTTMIVIGHFTWSRAVGWVEADVIWQELRMAAGLLLFGVAFGGRSWPRWRWMIVVAGVVVAAVQLLLILSGRTFSTDAGASAFYSHRPFGATFALFILAAFVILCSEPDRWTWQTTLTATFLGCSVVLAQHRSVWVALAVVCLLMMLKTLRGEGYRPARVPILVTIGFTGLAFLLPALMPWSLLPGGTSSGTGASVPDSVTDADSLGWRLGMWESRVRAARSLFEWLFGAVFGPTPVIGPEAQVTNPRFSAHSLWVDQLTMVGLVGLGTLLVLFAVALRTPGRLPELQILLWSVLAFGFFYNLTVWSYLLLGSALAVGARLAPSISQRASQDRENVPERGPSAQQEQHQGL